MENNKRIQTGRLDYVHPMLSIIIPCYNEGLNIPILIQKLQSISNDEIEIILVNNGSTDNTKYVIEELIKNIDGNFRLLNIKNNIGYGHGIMEGVKEAKGKVISWTHADLQTDPKDVVDAFKVFSNNNDYNNYILKGKRHGRNLFDTFFTSGMSLFSSLIMGVKLSDINAQPKMFSRKFLEELDNTPIDFSLDLYFLYQAKLKGYGIIEFPVKFSERILGDSKGGGTLKGKWSLIKRTWKYMIKLRKEIKN